MTYPSRCPQCNNPPGGMNAGDIVKWAKTNTTLCPPCLVKWNKPINKPQISGRCSVCSATKPDHRGLCDRCKAAGYRSPQLFRT